MMMDRDVVKHHRSVKERHPDRNAKMRDLYVAYLELNGKRGALKTIAGTYSITPARVHQIIFGRRRS
jgi:hypothetical protein